MSAPRTALGPLGRAWWGFDRACRGTPRRPSRPLARAAGHPVLTGLMGALFLGGTAAVGIGRMHRQVVIRGLSMGVFTGLVAVVERKGMERYGSLPRAAEDSACPPERREY
ncbi:hypothetical protein [Streptomyces sp. NPDC001970]